MYHIVYLIVISLRFVRLYLWSVYGIDLAIHKGMKTTTIQLLALALIAEFDANYPSDRFDVINNAFATVANGLPQLQLTGGHCVGTNGYLCPNDTDEGCTLCDECSTAEAFEREQNGDGDLYDGESLRDRNRDYMLAAWPKL